MALDFPQGLAGNIADLQTQIGQTRAKGIAANGQLLGGYLSGVANLVAQQPQRQLQQQEITARTADIKAQQEDRAAQAQQRQQQSTAAAAQQQRLADLYNDPSMKDESGNVDYAKLAPAAALINPQIGEHLATFAKAHAEALSVAAKAKNDRLDKAASLLVDAKTPEAQTAAAMMLPGLGLSKDEAATVGQVLESGQPAIDAFVNTYSSSAKAAKLKAMEEAAKPYDLSPGAQRFQGSQMIAENPKPADVPKTAAELALAANPNNPAAALAAIQGPADAARTETARHNQAMEAHAAATIKAAKPELDVSPDVQSTSTGVKYVDGSAYTAAERPQARANAEKNGALFLSKDDVSALHDVDTARKNQKDIMAQLDGLLPKNPQARAVALVTVPLSRALQTDAAKAAFNSWRTAAIGTLRATAGSKGLRINEAEIKQAVENDIPSLTDTVATAQQKVANINKLLDNAESPILRGRAGSAAPAATGGAQAPGGGQKIGRFDVVVH